MSVQLIFKIAAVGILVSVLCQVLKHSGREEQAFLTSLAGLLLVLFWILPYIQELFHSIEQLVFLIRDGEGGYELNAVQIGLVGVAGALLAIQFKNEKSEYGIYLSVAVSIFIFLNIVGRLEIILETLRAIGDMITIDRAYIGTLLKMVGITYAAEFSSGICKDAGLSDGGIPD